LLALLCYISTFLVFLCFVFYIIVCRAELLANEIKGLRGEMADYNTLNDMLNTDSEIDDILGNYSTVRIYVHLITHCMYNIRLDSPYLDFVIRYSVYMHYDNM